MADRIADNADHAVEELKRKARRRLVGAIVLALAAAVILPLLLEKEPKPLGDDVSVQIPPVDEGKFVNRLTGRGGDAKTSAKPGAKVDAKAETKAGNATAESRPATGASTAPATASPATAAATAPMPTNVPPPKKSLTEAEQSVLSPAAKPAAKPEPKPAPEPKAQTTPEATGVAAAPDATVPATVAVVAAPQAEPMAAPADSAATPAKADGFVVQLAAFADDKGANALAGKLRKAGYASAYVEPVETSRGTLWRVRVGGYATRADADAARAKLKVDGYAGMVALAK
jgi:DedD protein